MSEACEFPEGGCVDKRAGIGFLMGKMSEVDQINALQKGKCVSKGKCWNGLIHSFAAGSRWIIPLRFLGTEVRAGSRPYLHPCSSHLLFHVCIHLLMGPNLSLAGHDQ